MRGRYFKDKPQIDDEYYLGSYLIQIQKVIPYEEFSSGRCFLARADIVAKTGGPKGPKMFNSSMLHKKMPQSPRKSQELKTDIEIPEGSCVLTENIESDKAVVPVFIDAFLSS